MAALFIRPEPDRKVKSEVEAKENSDEPSLRPKQLRPRRRVISDQFDNAFVSHKYGLAFCCHRKRKNRIRCHSLGPLFYEKPKLLQLDYRRFARPRLQRRRADEHYSRALWICEPRRSSRPATDCTGDTQPDDTDTDSYRYALAERLLWRKTMAQEQTPGASSASAKSPPQQANTNTAANVQLASTLIGLLGWFIGI